ncbi:MAG: STAS domain-containing protein [Halanaerobiales bacterium]
MYKLPEVLDIYHVEDLQAELSVYFDKCREEEKAEVVLGAQQVEDVDAAGLQLLLSLQKTCSEAGMELVVEDKSAVLAKLFLLSGVKL